MHMLKMFYGGENKFVYDTKSSSLYLILFVSGGFFQLQFY